MANIELLEKTLPVAPIRIAALEGCRDLAEEVDKKLENIMKNIFKQCKDAAAKYDLGVNYVAGANIAAFDKVSKAMIAQGVI